MSKTTLYHNPRCSKSRATLALLQKHGIEPDIVEYCETPLNKAQLKLLMQQLNEPASAMIRTNDKDFAALGLSPATLTTSQCIDIIAKHPQLMQRPIVVHAGKARIGRPPEKVLEILG